MKKTCPACGTQFGECETGSHLAVLLEGEALKARIKSREQARRTTDEALADTP